MLISAAVICVLMTATAVLLISGAARTMLMAAVTMLLIAAALGVGERAGESAGR
jgi:hypothetical protein